MGFENFESIPTEEQAVYIVDPYKKTSNNNVGILEVQFEFIISEVNNYLTFPFPNFFFNLPV